jgi:hypothetical protein
MKINYHGHAKRTEKTIDTCIRIATDYNAGMTVAEIQKRYISPKTKKNYTRAAIYKMLKKAQTIDVKTL